MLYEPFRNGRPIGTHKHWHGKDRLKSVRAYNDAGEMDGWSMDWAENGALEDSVFYAKNEKREGYFFRESGKLMLYEKTRRNPRTGPYDGYYRGPYDILEAASFDSTDKRNGEVKGGNGRLIILSACSGIDTVEVADSHVLVEGYYDGYLDVNHYGPNGISCMR
jgi:antitoxin component YwqK of YwqJK toxin-antitoxin module